ncbi:MAG: carboxypeptidase-like regulatory domain-containing protein [Chloroflexi bacterium]|nr:carboxypeptidase-like regulatory domain-containing protein [Chloroflexota bacterium]
MAGVTVTVTTEAGVPLVYQTGNDGRYQAPLRPGQYMISVAPFGFVPYSAGWLVIVNGQTTTHNIQLTSLPRGTVSGQLKEAGTMQPVQGTIRVAGTPVVMPSGPNGWYSLSLPPGQYDLTAVALGHRLGYATVTVTAGNTTNQNFVLIPAPTTLLIDSGQWYYWSQAAYYQAALEDNDYAYDLWTVRDPYSDAPPLDLLTDYEVVIWSAPLDSPGSVIGAGQVISDYLGLGGNLFVSGQNVALMDSILFNPQYWFYGQLKGQYEGKAQEPFVLTGAGGTLFDGLAFTLNGPDSAANQDITDEAAPRDGSLTEVIFRYVDGAPAGLQANACAPFHVVYLGFGLEGVSGAANRADIVQRTYDYFALPEPEYGLDFLPDEIDSLGSPGSQLTFTLTVFNRSETLTDTFQLSLDDPLWPSSLMTTTLTLGPCQGGRTILSVTVPEGLDHGVHESFNISAVSGNFPAYSRQLPVHLKTPDYILLVDDYRWYSQATVFRAALENAGFQYDYWEIGPTENVNGSPSVELLNGYDIVVWYTGYDWYAPINQEQSEALYAYLSEGGRLFLTSQDYMYYHPDDPLTRDYLGVLDYRESVTPTRVFGGDNMALMGNLAGPLPLEYDPYQNFSDGLVPQPGVQVSLWHNEGMAAGLATAGPDWRTIFWAVPFEKLPAGSHATAMNRLVGWLSDLGDSTFAVDQRTGPLTGPGAIRTYTLTLRNIDAGYANQVAITNTLPVSLALDLATISGGASYDPATRQLTWTGELASGASHVISYQAAPADGLPAGTRLDNPVTIYYERHDLRFERIATVWPGAPDLSQSTLQVTSGQNYQPLTYTLTLINSGFAPGANGLISATVRLPDDLGLLTDTLSVSSGQATITGRRLAWSGGILPGEVVTVSVVMTAGLPSFPTWMPATAVIEDGVTEALVRDGAFYLVPYQVYFPAIAKN